MLTGYRSVVGEVTSFEPRSTTITAELITMADQSGCSTVTPIRIVWTCIPAARRKIPLELRRLRNYVGPIW